MPDGYRVTLTKRAGRQLQEMFRYIEQDSPQNAAKMIARIIDAIDRLGSMPRRYKAIGSTESVGEVVRSMPVKPYFVHYHVNESSNVVTVLSVQARGEEARIKVLHLLRRRSPFGVLL